MSSKSNSRRNKNLRIITSFLEKSLRWKYAKQLFESRFRILGDVAIGPDELQSCAFIFDIFDTGAFFILSYPFVVPKSRKDSVCELVVRINNRMWDGKFDYIIELGRIKFRLFQPIDEQGRISQKRLKRLVRVPSQMLNNFYEAFNNVIHKTKSPEDAVINCFR